MDSMTKAEVMRLIDSGHETFDAAVNALTPEQMAKPIGDSEWTPKDVVAHVTWSQREMLSVLHHRAMVGSDLWDLSQDERNAAVFAENRARPLDDVLQDAREVFAQLRSEIERLSDDQLNNPAYIKDIPGGITPWQLLSGSTWRHYEEHTNMLSELA